MSKKTVASVIPREILGGIIMASVFSSIFFYLPFRGMDVIELGANQKFPVDFFPQAFFLGFFCSLMPQLLVSKSIHKGQLVGTALSLKKSLLRSALFSIAFVAILGTLFFLISSKLEGVSLSFSSALMVKIAFATLVAIIVTPLALKPMTKLQNP